MTTEKILKFKELVFVIFCIALTIGFFGGLLIFFISGSYIGLYMAIPGAILLLIADIKTMIENRNKDDPQPPWTY